MWWKVLLAVALQSQLVSLNAPETEELFPNQNMLQYNGYQTVRVLFKSKVAISSFLEFVYPGDVEFYTASYPDMFLSMPSTSGVTEILLPKNATRRNSILQFLKTNRIMFEVAGSSDFNRGVEKAARKVEKVQRYQKIAKIAGFFPRYNEIVQWLRQIEAAFPNIVSVERYGRSFEGRELLAVRTLCELLGLNLNLRQDFYFTEVGHSKNRNKPLIFVESGMHGREWLVPATCIWIIDQVVQFHAYEYNRVQTLLGALYNFVFVIVANPDGYEYSHTTDRLWRKTRSVRSLPMCADSGCVYRRNVTCIGVDGNRNWDAHFGEVGTMGDCRETYPGPKPFSEVEVQSLAKYIESVKTKTRFYLSLHAVGQTWAIPPGYVRDRLRNHAAQLKYAKIAAEAIKLVGGPEYIIGTHADLQYMVSGSSADWAIENDIPFAATVNLSPALNVTDYKSGASVFSATADQVELCGKYIHAALKALAKALHADASRSK